MQSNIDLDVYDMYHIAYPDDPELASISVFKESQSCTTLVSADCMLSWIDSNRPISICRSDNRSGDMADEGFNWVSS